jgi:hypothetical protein
MKKQINKKNKTKNKVSKKEPSRKGMVRKWIEEHDQMNHGKKVHVTGYFKWFKK